ncbi:MAK10-like protein [Tanacetum coccineum]
MGDENPIRTLGDYFKPSHEGYRNTIELPVGNNLVPIRSDTIRLVQNGYSFHGLRSKDPNQHLKDFLKLVDSLDLDGENKERTRLRLFQFSLRDQASNWIERLLAGSITTWEDLTTRFLAQFFPPRRTAKLRNDILIRTIDQSVGGKLRDLNAEESWALLEDLSLYDNESWNDPRDFAKPVKAIALPQDVPSTFVRRLIELENQVQHLMEAHLALTQPTQVNKITTPCVIYSGPHDTQYCMENPEQAFVDYASCLGLVPPSPNAELVCTKEEDGDVMFVEIIPKDDSSHKEEPEAEVQEVEYFNIFPTRRNFTYVVDFMIIEDISSIIDPRLSQVVLGRPFSEISNMTHDLPEGVVRFTNENDEVAYKMLHKIEQWYVMDIRKRMNNEAKRTKPSTGMERVPVIRGLDVASNQGSRSIAWRIIKIEGPGMVDEERPRVMDPSPHPYIRRPPHSLRSRLVLAYF